MVQAQAVAANDVEGARALIESLEAQLCDIYAERAKEGEALQASGLVRSLVEQLEAVYADQERAGPAADMNESLVSQVESLYADRLEHDDMVASLEGQVAVLLEERNDLAAEVEELRARVKRVEHMAKSVVSGMADQMFNQI